ncbi:MAG: hypothetical protein HY335_08500 [Deinococcus sp.]|nr:hypothetical protein [Deinococcus sp.]
MRTLLSIALALLCSIAPAQGLLDIDGLRAGVQTARDSIHTLRATLRVDTNPEEADPTDDLVLQALAVGDGQGNFVANRFALDAPDELAEQFFIVVPGDPTTSDDDLFALYLLLTNQVIITRGELAAGSSFDQIVGGTRGEEDDDLFSFSASAFDTAVVATPLVDSSQAYTVEAFPKRARDKEDFSRLVLTLFGPERQFQPLRIEFYDPDDATKLSQVIVFERYQRDVELGLDEVLNVCNPFESDQIVPLDVTNLEGTVEEAAATCGVEVVL